ncbi:Proteasome non-ATPase 26S subunit [Phytophthora infestans]|uniref:Proteasome non-ATPase 26S subunit n=1 Tax=Phytophthora infestans TaxID=4787 RepID=A0A833WI74_PHYIN|nr:Proteasome non-ATPase 26S subunit [Phytophthora infestans]
MDINVVWQEIMRFQETVIGTSGHLYAAEQENALVHDFLERIPVETLFACLQDASDRGSSKQVKQACACINRVLSAEDDGTGLFFQPDIVLFVLAGLAHVEKEARVLVVNQFIAHLGRKPSLDQVKVVADPLVLTQVCDVITDEDIEVAAKASTVLEMLSNIANSGIYQAVLDSLKTKAQSSEITENSIEFLRYLETIMKICAQKDEHMEYGISSGAIDLILNCLKSDDPLFLMNVVDLVPALCQTKIGVQYIFQSGTLKTLLAMTEDPFVGGNAVRLVGEVSATAASLNIQSWSWSDATLSKAFLETVERKMQSSDSLQQIAAMDALAAFASSSDKELQLLLQYRSICQVWLQFGSSTKMPVKANCFHSLARVLGAHTRLAKQPEQVPEENAGVWNMCERLFNSLGVECAQQSTIVLLMNALKQPFEELRTSVFHVLRSVAAQNSAWGMRALLSYGGFFEFLMDRTTEPTKETREWKFAVLDAALASPFHSLLDASLLEKLQASLRRGPYAGAAAPAEMELESA